MKVHAKTPCPVCGKICSCSHFLLRAGDYAKLYFTCRNCNITFMTTGVRHSINKEKKEIEFYEIVADPIEMEWPAKSNKFNPSER